MIFPDKLTSFQNSIIAKSIYILKELDVKSQSASNLFLQTQKHFEDISEFMLALDTLYILEKIIYNEQLKVIKYVKKNNL